MVCYRSDVWFIYICLVVGERGFIDFRGLVCAGSGRVMEAPLWEDGSDNNDIRCGRCDCT